MTQQHLRCSSFYDDYDDVTMWQVLLGLAAGTLGCCVNIPFDVAKSRIQGPQPVPGEVKYRGTARVIAMVYREEGWVPHRSHLRQS